MKQKITTLLMGIIIFITIATAVQASDMSYETEAHWRFDNGQVNATHFYDSFAGNDPLVLDEANNYTLTAGIRNQAVTFYTHDSNEAEELTKTSLDAQELAISMWIKVNNVSNLVATEIFWRQGDGTHRNILFRITTSAILQFYLAESPTVIRLNSIPQGNGNCQHQYGVWSHYLATYDNSTLTFYLYKDGELCDSILFSTARTYDATQDNKLWEDNENSDTEFDEMGIWHQTFTAMMANAVYNEGTPVGASDYVGNAFGYANITAKSAYNQTTINNFTIEWRGVNFTTTNGILETIAHEDEALQNVTIYSTGFITQTAEINISAINNYQFNLTQNMAVTGCGATGTKFVGQNISLAMNYTAGTGVGTPTELHYWRNHDDNVNMINYETNNSYILQDVDFADQIRHICRICTPYQCNSSAVYIWAQTDEIEKTIYFRAYDYLGVLLTNPEFTTDNPSYTMTGNTYPMYLSNFLNSTVTEWNMTVNITDLLSYNADLTANTTMWENITYYDYNMSPNNLVLSFSGNATGVIRDSNPIDGLGDGMNFTNSTLAVIQQDMSLGKVTVRFTLINTTWTQYYEYLNDNTPVTDSLQILSTADSYAWMRVLDQSNNPIENAIVRLYQLAPTTGNMENYTLIGQRLTDDEGYTYYQFDTGNHLLIAISHDGHTTIRDLIEAQDVIHVEEEDADIYKMEATDTGTSPTCDMYMTTKYSNGSANIEGDIYCHDRTTVEFITTYSDGLGHLNTALIGNSIDLYPITLVPDTHFSSTANATITVKIYIDSVNEFNWTINYDNTAYTDIIPQSDLVGLNQGLLIILLGLGLIIMSSAIGILLESGTAGFTTFMFGGLFTGVLISSYSYLSYICLIYFVGRIIHRVMKE